MRRTRSLARPGRAPSADAAGFTLVELLVVVAIIGLLAAIAIPKFLSHRTKAYDTAAKSDLRNIAATEEAYLTSHPEYGTLGAIVADGQPIRISHDVTVRLVRVDGAAGYCLAAQHRGSAIVWYYDSASGGILPAGTPDCPVTTSGVAGDSLG
jgi:type IV pilus assembly protein PilA